MVFTQYPPGHKQVLGLVWLCGSLELGTHILLVAWLVSQHTSLTLVNWHISNYRSSGNKLSTVLWREMERQIPCDIWNLAGTCREPPAPGDTCWNPFQSSPEWIPDFILSHLSLQGNVLGELGQKRAEVSTAWPRTKIKHHHMRKVTSQAAVSLLAVTHWPE